jgi:hypothetical protein
MCGGQPNLEGIYKRSKRKGISSNFHKFHSTIHCKNTPQKDFDV